MNTADDVLRLIVGAHALTRLAALDARSEAPAAQWRTLSLLRDHGPQRVGDLATLSRVTQPGMTRLVGQLAAAGLVDRGTDAADSRASIVTLSPAGEAALDTWLEVLRDALTPRLVDLDDGDRAALARVAGILDRLTRVPEIAR
jgi:DNA-binding MarR family transcriptional regulator